MMRADKEAANKMRRDGKSYTEILAALKIPKATLSNWFGHVNWSRDIRKKLTAAAGIVSTERIRELDRVRGKHLERVYGEARGEARKEFEGLKYNPLFIAGLMLYWGEGDKVTKQSTRLINADPEMIRLFVLFLREVCRIPKEKIRAQAIIYPDLDPDGCIAHWSRAAGIPRNSFTKCSVIIGRHKTKRLSHGTCTIYVSSTYFKVKMLEWLSRLPKELMSTGYYANIAT